MHKTFIIKKLNKKSFLIYVNIKEMVLIKKCNKRKTKDNKITKLIKFDKFNTLQN